MSESLGNNSSIRGSRVSFVQDRIGTKRGKGQGQKTGSGDEDAGDSRGAGGSRGGSTSRSRSDGRRASGNGSKGRSGSFLQRERRTDRSGSRGDDGSGLRGAGGSVRITADQIHEARAALLRGGAEAAEVRRKMAVLRELGMSLDFAEEGMGVGAAVLAEPGEGLTVSYDAEAADIGRRQAQF